MSSSKLEAVGAVQHHGVCCAVLCDVLYHDALHCSALCCIVVCCATERGGWYVICHLSWLVCRCLQAVDLHCQFSKVSCRLQAAGLSLDVQNA